MAVAKVSASSHISASVAGSGILTQTVTPSVTAGNRIVVATVHFDDNATPKEVNTPTDAQGNTYTAGLSNSVVTLSGKLFVTLWSAVAGSTGSNVITVTTVASGTANGELTIACLEYSGADTSAGSAWIDQSATGAGQNQTTTNPTTGTTAATAAAGQMAIALVGDTGSGVTWTVSSGGETKDAAASNTASTIGGMAVADKTSASGATETCTFTCGNALNSEVALIVVMKAASAVVALPPWSRPAQRPPVPLSPVYFQQASRLDANTVAPAANTLPSPLDVAFAAGGTLWQRWNMAATLADRKTLQPQQARRAFDPNALLTITYVGNSETQAWWSEDSEVHQIANESFRRISDPNITPVGVPPAPPTLSNLWHTAVTHRRDPYPTQQLRQVFQFIPIAPPLVQPSIQASYSVAPRTWLPQQYQQRVGLAGGISLPAPLDTAGGVGGTLWRTQNAAALIWPRLWIARQHLYVSPPSLLILPSGQFFRVSALSPRWEAEFLVDRWKSSPLRQRYAAGALAPRWKVGQHTMDPISSSSTPYIDVPVYVPARPTYNPTADPVAMAFVDATLFPTGPPPAGTVFQSAVWDSQNGPQTSPPWHIICLVGPSGGTQTLGPNASYRVFVRITDGAEVLILEVPDVLRVT